MIKMIDFVCMEGAQMNTKINQLLEYALKNGMIEEYDYDYCANLLIDLFGIYEFKREQVEECSIYEILDFTKCATVDPRLSVCSVRKEEPISQSLSKENRRCFLYGYPNGNRCHPLCRGG